MKSLGRKEKAGLFIVILVPMIAGGVFLYYRYGHILTDPFVREQAISRIVPKSLQDDYIRFRSRDLTQPHQDIAGITVGANWRRVGFAKNDDPRREGQYTVLIPDEYLVESVDQMTYLELYRKTDHIPGAASYEQPGPKLWFFCDPRYGPVAAEASAEIAVYLSASEGEPDYVTAFPITLNSLSGWRAIGSEAFEVYHSTYVDIGEGLCEISVIKAKGEITDAELEEFYNVADAVISTLRFDGS